LMEAAERGGSIEAATEQFELALFLEARLCVPRTPSLLLT
jgi:hypothetical protein